MTFSGLSIQPTDEFDITKSIATFIAEFSFTAHANDMITAFGSLNVHLKRTFVHRVTTTTSLLCKMDIAGRSVVHSELLAPISSAYDLRDETLCTVSHRAMANGIESTRLNCTGHTELSSAHAVSIGSVPNLKRNESNATIHQAKKGETYFV